MSNRGVFANINSLNEPCVLYMDYNGWWAPLSSLYFSSSSQMLVSKHPGSCVQEIISFYCPQCLTRYMEEDVKNYQFRCPSCFQCPSCTGFLTVVALNSIECVFQCALCMWRSDECGIKGADKSELEIAVVERERTVCSDAFKAVLAALQTNNNIAISSKIRSSASISSMLTPTPTISEINEVASESGTLPSRWQIEDAEMKWHQRPEPYIPFKESALYQFLSKDSESLDNFSDVPSEEYLKSQNTHNFTSLQQRYNLEPLQPLLTCDMVPVRVCLRSKKTLRCRKDVDEGKLSILVQPKTFPLEGDSSLKQRGNWWVKDASAIHEVPRIVIKKIPTLLELQSADKKLSCILIEISNPKDFPVIISFTGIPQSTLPDLVSSLTITTPTPQIKDSREESSSAEPESLPSLTTDTNTVTIASTIPLHDKRPPFSTIITPLILPNNQNSQEFTLEAYEDELLRDEQRDNLSDSQQSSGEHWDISVDNNVAKVAIPVAIRSRDTISTSTGTSPSSASVAELLLSLNVREVTANENNPTENIKSRASSKGYKLENIMLRIAFPVVSGSLIVHETSSG